MGYSDFTILYLIPVVGVLPSAMIQAFERAFLRTGFSSFRTLWFAGNMAHFTGFMIHV
jgi:hypothetical protein